MVSKAADIRGGKTYTDMKEEFEAPASAQVIYSWSQSVGIEDWAHGKIHGWFFRTVEKGDYMLFKSGKKEEYIFVTKIVSAKQQRDPRDMYFLMVEVLYALPASACPPERRTGGVILT